MFNFDNTYIKLPNNFYQESLPESFSKPELIVFNKELALSTLGLKETQVSDETLANFFSGQKLMEGSEPIAIAYAGHQFGNFVPQLGDGRAVLIGEVTNDEGKRFDLQLKGSGQTYFSRGGDGKSSLGPVIREYIVSEAMHYLGVPTTRALAAVTTGDLVYRESALPGGVFTRVASSHIRIGTFEYFAARNELDSIEELTRYAINRHYPEIKNDKEIYLSFLKVVAEAQSNLVAKWMSLGFIHGVMNTDNMSISGETIDFGPCAFIDNFSFDRVFSSIDRHGRYAYNNQINIAKWNLYRLAECFIPLIDKDQTTAIKKLENTLKSITPIYEANWLKEMRKKFGLSIEDNSDETLINEFLKYLEEEDLDFTLSFRALSEDHTTLKQSVLRDNFIKNWQDRISKEDYTFEKAKEMMLKNNPVFIPRNHQVERAIQEALSGEYKIFHELNDVLQRPFLDQENFSQYKVAPLPNERIQATFCGT